MSKETAFYGSLRVMTDRWMDLFGYFAPAVVTDTQREYRAVREAAGLMDFSMLRKVDLDGEGALGLVNSIVCRDGGSPTALCAMPTGRWSTTAPSCRDRQVAIRFGSVGPTIATTRSSPPPQTGWGSRFVNAPTSSPTCACKGRRAEPSSRT